ncbi:MAG: ATP-binding cassette domain-containing protein [Alphaproteobacteria bacterium]|nr:ATP-binding cassette domain-containing protein [Alphaproteobacteria bacterium]
MLRIEKFSLNIERKGKEPIQVLHDISLCIRRNEKVAVVGASGAGKTMIMRAVLGILPSQAVPSESTKIYFHDTPIYNAGEYCKAEHLPIAVILQDPLVALNPMMTVEKQIGEALPGYMSKVEKFLEVKRLLHSVQLFEADRIAKSYPGQLSGGMAQRVMVAMMMALKPLLLIGDEPTSSLDAPVGVEILRLIDQDLSTRQASFLLISHDINMVRNFTDRIIVMHEGRVVENILSKNLKQSVHPHTRKLLTAITQ